MSFSSLCIWITFVVIPQLSLSYTKTCGWYGCDETTINCPPNEDCHIKCSGLHSCESSIINCPSNYQCTIDCTNTAACYGITVYGQHSSKLEFTDCKSGAFDYTCADMTVFCPPNINGNKICKIPGDNSMGGKHEPYMQFYAINGWNDIDFSGYSGSSNGRRGTMHCTNDYSQSCSIDSSSSTGYWTCADNNNICMHPPTNQPTTMPTATSITPTNNPTSSPTNIPSYMPTVRPTTFPTNTPTKMPSDIPTTAPTIRPTTFPSNTPTISPSIHPSVSPTQVPIARPSKDISLVISGDFNSDSLEVKDAITTGMNVEPIDEAINATTKHNSDMLHQYILWIGLGVVFVICNCIICIYCHAKRKSRPKIYHIDHYGDTKNIEMEQSNATGVIIDNDGNETVIPPKNGTIKYSPFGAMNDNIINIQSKPVSVQVKIPISTLSVHSISKICMDITPNSVSSMKHLDSFVLDAKNDEEVLGNDLGTTPQSNDAIITPQFDDNKNDFDMVVNENVNNVIDNDMIIYVNNDIVIDENGRIETKGNDVNNIESED